jgi:hypothetical protein
VFRQAVAALSLATTLSVASAATLFETTELVASTPAAAAQVPPPIEFEVAMAGNYVAQLSDLALPGAFESLSAIVTHDLQVVAKLQIQSGTVQANGTFAATPGTYRIHVLGAAPAGQESGTFAVTVSPQAGGTALVDTAGTIVGDLSAPPGAAELVADFNIAATGSYDVAVTDHAFPAALDSLQLLLVRDTATGPEEITRAAGTFTLQAGSYHLTVIATAAATEQAGLYSARVSGSSGVAYQSTNRVGELPAPIDVSLPGTGQYTLSIADANFPTALTAFAALVAQNSTVLGQRSGAGDVAIAGTQGTAQLFTFATTPTVGAYRIRLVQGATTVFSDVRAVDASPAPDTPAIYFFESSNPIAAGNYRLTLNDFRFPAALPSLHAAVVQGDTVVDSTDQAAALDVALQAGRVKALVAVEPPAGTPSQPNSGLFGIDLSAVQGANVFESTQGVGGLFRSELVQVATNGNYELTVADLEFPAALGTSALAVTRGTDLVAQIFGGSKVSRTLAAGTYVLNFIGQPAAGQVHGTYGLKLADAPAAPTVTLIAAPGTITAGDRTTLTWTATNATTCTAANGWTGSKAMSGSEQTDPLNANATFELSCSGPGGTTGATASVVVNPRAAGGGGGGSTGVLLLIYMAALAWRRRHS